MNKREAAAYAKNINKGLPAWCPPITAEEAGRIPLLRIRDLTDFEHPNREYEVQPSGYLREVKE